MTERLRDDLDTLAEAHRFSGRSEVIRDACQSLLEAYRETEYEGKRVLATVTAVFGYDNPTVEGQMVEVRREFEASIRSISHNCLENKAGCVETFVLEAEYSDVLRFIRLVRGAGESVSSSTRLSPSIRCNRRAASTEHVVTGWFEKNTTNPY